MNILIVDDHTVMRQGIQRLLGVIEGATVIEAGTARDAMLAARRVRPDLVVLDINLKETSGLDLLRRLRTEWPGLRVVVFSMYADAVYARTALRLGALGFVSKSSPAEELVAAARHGLRGEGYIDRGTAQALDLVSLSPRMRTASRAARRRSCACWPTAGASATSPRSSVSPTRRWPTSALGSRRSSGSTARPS